MLPLSDRFKDPEFLLPAFQSVYTFYNTIAIGHGRDSMVILRAHCELSSRLLTSFSRISSRVG
jgi:hypothetical protein